VSQEPPFTIYTDKTKACQDYVWYSSENLNANTALQVCPGGVSIPVADTRTFLLITASADACPAHKVLLPIASACDGVVLGTRLS